jgi:hypothetical protein
MFYTYLWLREDGTPYYVGKGKGRRAFRQGSPPQERIVVHPAESEDDAFETETVLIWYYGRKDLGTGCLRNLTVGGEGFAGGRHTLEWRSEQSLKMQGNNYNDGYKNNLGNMHSEATKQKISKAKLGRPSWNKGKTLSEEHKKNLVTSHLGHKPTKETRDKMRQSFLLRPRDKNGRVMAVAA